MINSKYTVYDITERGLFCDGDWIEKKDQDKNGNIRLIQLADIGDGYFIDKSNKYINEDTAKRLNCTFLKKGDILISRLGSPLGKACIFPLDGKCITAVDVAIVRIVDPSINRKCVMHLINSLEFRSKIVSYQTGTTRKRISRKNLAKITFELPPLPEQERIVAKIEELFSELDNAVETLNATKAQLAVYRQSVLKEAFDIDRFPKVEMENIVDDIKVGPFGTMLHKEDYIVGGVPVINPQHIKYQRINPSKKVTISEQKAHELSSYRLQKNDIIMGRRGEMGRTAPISSIEDGWICGTGSIIFRLKPEFDALFYSKILSSPNIIAYLEKSATGTTMKNLNEKIVKHIPVPMITREKQLELISFLEDRLSICENIEKTVDSVLQQASAMRQSILKQAFEGRLL